MKNTTIITTCLVLFIGLIACSACKDDESLPEEGLVAHYPFDGNANDEKLGNNGNPDDVQWMEDRKGQKASAAYFDGDKAIIVVPHSGAINFDKNQDYAISCWLKYGDQKDTKEIDNYVLSKWWPSGNYPFSLRINNQTQDNVAWRGTVYTGRWDGDCKNGASAGFKRKTDDNVWHHFVAIKQGTLLRTYVDGDLMEEAPDNTICSTQNTSDFYIGMGRPGDTGARYQGAIDDLRIYNRALSAEDVHRLRKE